MTDNQLTLTQRLAAAFAAAENVAPGERPAARIAREEGLPPRLAGRLVGDTDDELRADARMLRELLSLHVSPMERLRRGFASGDGR